MNDNSARTEKPSAEKLRKIMAQISNMLAKADDPSCTPAEADQNRERAEVLMRRYRLEESEMSAEDQTLLGIAVKRARWTVCPYSSEFSHQYRALVAYVVNHIEAECVMKYDNGNIVAEVFAYESDLMYGERLFNSMRLAFSTRLEPKVDADATEAENVFILRNAGMERRRIAEVLGWSPKSGPFKASKLFKEECERRGEDANVLLGKGNSVKNYREQYANSFVVEVWSRLARMRATAGADSAGLVMADRHEKVREAMYTAYPNLRPNPVTTTKRIGEEQGECPKCAKASSGFCREHAWMKPSRARSSSGPAYNHAAAERGRAAARSVDLGQSSSLNR